MWYSHRDNSSLAFVQRVYNLLIHAKILTQEYSTVKTEHTFWHTTHPKHTNSTSPGMQWRSYKDRLLRFEAGFVRRLHISRPIWKYYTLNECLKPSLLAHLQSKTYLICLKVVFHRFLSLLLLAPFPSIIVCEYMLGNISEMSDTLLWREVCLTFFWFRP